MPRKIADAAKNGSVAAATLTAGRVRGRSASAVASSTTGSTTAVSLVKMPAIPATNETAHHTALPFFSQRRNASVESSMNIVSSGSATAEAQEIASTCAGCTAKSAAESQA